MHLNKISILHPFLFGISPIIFIWAQNLREVSFLETLMPISFVLVFTFLLLLLLGFAFKNYIKSGIIITIFWLFLWTYGDICYLLKGLRFVIARHRYLMSIWVFLFVMAVLAIIRVKKQKFFENGTRYLNFVSIILVLISLIQIGTFKVKNILQARTNIEIPTDFQNKETTVALSSTQTKELPDIYYIILDAYGRADVLKEMYGYDNSEFINMLAKKGFYIASKSRSNYPGSFLSLSSSLNMDYINYLSEKIGKDSKDPTIPYRMIADNKVWKFLKSKGYKFVFFSSGWQATMKNKYADIVYNYGPSVEFIDTLVSKTWLFPLSEISFIDFTKNYRRKCVLYNFEKLGEVPKIKESTFVFAHILIPHPPFLFNRNGEPAQLKIVDTFKISNEHSEDFWVEREKTLYIEQLIFINRKIELLIDKILSESNIPPIIILQADHGPWFVNPIDDIATEARRKEKFNILNAYYLTREVKQFLYEDITPVNSFRLIFNRYFGANYDLLADESYFSNSRYPYRFIQVPKEDNGKKR